jgi:hypothetical protein
MRKWFRNLLLTIVTAFAFNANAQGNIEINYNQYNQWVLSNQPCVGCGSFFVMVVNNPNPNNGYYYYDIYLWTNSSYRNGFIASTYLKNINFYLVGASGNEIKVFNMVYAVVPPKSSYFNGYFYIAYVYSLSPSQTIKLTWSEANPW